MKKAVSLIEFDQNEYDIIEFHNDIHSRIQVHPMYFKLGFSPFPNIFGRSTVLNRLLDALAFLPEDYGFLIWDVYRPRSVQAKLFNWMSDEIRLKHPLLSEEENYIETRKYMSPPSNVGDSYCPPHLSGGAIDLTLYECNTGKELEMGTPFDDCTSRAHSDYFDSKSQLTPGEETIKSRRQLLHTVMKKVGFTTYQYEWWHFDIGNIFWSHIVQSPAVFGPLFNDEEWPKTIHKK